MSRNTFSGFQSFEDFIDGRKASVSLTTNGSQVLTINGAVSATIIGELKGSTLQETVNNLRAVNLTLGIPHPGSKDNAGRPSLPCIMESKSDWESIDL